MSTTEEDQLLESLDWSGHDYPLEQFLDSYALPQLVRIEEGHYGDNTFTSFGTGDVLTLHALSSRKSLVGDDCNGKPLTVSLDCPVKVHVYPLRNDHRYLSIRDGKVVGVCPGARYVKALEGYMNEDDEDECFEVDDVLEIMDFEKEKSIIRFRNMATEDELSLPLVCSTSFVLLLDHKEYTVEEVKEKFDLPAKVSFISTGDDELSQSLSTIGSITLLGEIDEAVVISTTEGGTSEDKVCHYLPKDFDVNVCVAEGLVSGDETYETIVRNLHDDARVRKLFDPDQLAVYRAREAVHKLVQPTRRDFLNHEPSTYVVRKHAELRSKLFKDDKRAPESPKPNLDEQSPEESHPENTRNQPYYVNVKKLDYKNTLSEQSLYENPVQSFATCDESNLYDALIYDVTTTTTNQDSLAGATGHRRNPTRSPGATSDPPALPQRDYETSSSRSSIMPTSPMISRRSDECSLVSPTQQGSTGYNEFNQPVEDATHKRYCLKGAVEKSRPNTQSETPTKWKTKSLSKRRPPYQPFSLEEARYQSTGDTYSELTPNQDELKNLKTSGLFNRRQLSQPFDSKKATGRPMNVKPAHTGQQELKKALSKQKMSSLPNMRRLASKPPVSTKPSLSTDDTNSQLTPEHGPENVYEKPIADWCHNTKTPPSEHSDVCTTMSRIPADLSRLTVDGVGEVLKELNMEDYVEIFDRELVNGEMLMSMDEECLKSLNMNHFQRLRMIKLIKGWRP